MTTVVQALPAAAGLLARAPRRWIGRDARQRAGVWIDGDLGRLGGALPGLLAPRNPTGGSGEVVEVDIGLGLGLGEGNADSFNHDAPPCTWPHAAHGSHEIDAVPLTFGPATNEKGASASRRSTAAKTFTRLSLQR